MSFYTVSIEGILYHISTQIFLFFLAFLQFNYSRSPLFAFRFRQDVTVSVFRQSIFFIASFELKKIKLFSSCASILWYAFLYRDDNRNVQTQTRDTVNICSFSSIYSFFCLFWRRRKINFVSRECYIAFLFF